MEFGHMIKIEVALSSSFETVHFDESVTVTPVMGVFLQLHEEILIPFAWVTSLKSVDVTLNNEFFYLKPALTELFVHNYGFRLVLLVY